MNHVAAAVLEPLHHDLPRLVAVGEADGQQLAQGRVLLEGHDQLVGHLIRFDPVPDFLSQVTRNDAIAL